MRPKFKGQISLPSPTAQVCFYLSYTQGKALVPALYRSFLSDSQLESFISCLLHPCGSEQKFKVTNGEQLPRGSCQFQTQLTALNFSSWFNFGLRRLDSLLVNSAIDLEIFLKTILFSIFSCFQWQGYLGYCRTIVSHLLLFIVCIFFSSYIFSQLSRVRAWFSAGHVLSSRGLLFLFGNCSRIP